MKAEKISVTSRLKKLESLLGLKPSEMASLGGCSRATYYRYRKGESAPTLEFLNRILNHEKNVNAEWFFDEDESALKNGDGAGMIISDSDNESGKRYFDFPIYRNGQNDKLLPDSISFSRNFLNMLLKKEVYDGIFIMVAEDNSMMPEVKQGGVIFVDKKQVKPHSDGIFVVRYDDFVRMKIIQPLPGHKLMLTTLDKKYESIIVEKDQDGFEILGRIIWTINPM